MTKKTKLKPVKPTNGHLTVKESKRTIVLSWGKYSVTVLYVWLLLLNILQYAK